MGDVYDSVNEVVVGLLVGVSEVFEDVVFGGKVFRDDMCGVFGIFVCYEEYVGLMFEDFVMLDGFGRDVFFVCFSFFGDVRVVRKERVDGFFEFVVKDKLFDIVGIDFMGVKVLIVEVVDLVVFS